MNKGITFFLVIFVVAAVLFASGAIYVIDETEQVVVTQFGKLIGEPITQSGLYFKFPWWKANIFDKRILEWDGDADQIPTREKRLIWVDSTARWRIVDPLKFMKRVGNETSVQTRLDDILDAKTREVISGHALVEAIRNSNRLLEKGQEDVLKSAADAFGKTALEKIKKGREQLSSEILIKAEERVNDYGIQIVDFKIKRINYVEGVRNKVYERMISERKRAAEQFRSEGQGKKAEIEGQMTKELEQIQSEAYKTAKEIQGKADAEAIKIYADAYNKDPEFYSFIQTLESYRKTINEDTTLILSTDNDFYGYLQGIKGTKSLP